MLNMQCIIKTKSCKLYVMMLVLFCYKNTEYNVYEQARIQERFLGCCALGGYRGMLPPENV